MFWTSGETYEELNREPNACFIAVKAGLENSALWVTYPGAMGIENSMHTGYGHHSPKIIRKLLHKLLAFPVLGYRFLHCFFSFADNVLPCFTNTVWDLFLNILIIFLQFWNKHEVNVWVSFSLHYFVYQVSRICAFF